MAIAMLTLDVVGAIYIYTLWGLNQCFPAINIRTTSDMFVAKVHCKKCGVTEHPRGAIFYCFHGNPYCYHGNSKILLP